MVWIPKIRAVTYRCTGVIAGGACLDEDEGELFRHPFKKNAPALSEDNQVDGCVQVVDGDGIRDAVVCETGHGGPKKRLGSVVSFETDEGVERFAETSLWTDATGHQLFLRRDNPRRENGSGKTMERRISTITPGPLPSDGVLYFHRSTCKECTAAKPNVEKLAERVKVVAVDVDRFPQIARRFGVRGVPTLVILSGGKKVGEVHDPARVARLLDRRTLRTTSGMKGCVTEGRRAWRWVKAPT